MKSTCKLLLMVISTIAMFALSEAGFAAQSEPIDLRPISATVVKQHISELAEVVEKYSPYLKNPVHRAEFEAEAERLEDSVHGSTLTWQGWLLQQKLLRTLGHPHLTIYPEFLENRGLPLDFKWVSNGLLISPASWAHPAPVRFPKNSVVVRIGGDTPQQLLPKLETLYAGTPEWVSYLSAGDALPFAFALRWVGLVQKDDRVAITIRTPHRGIRRLDVAVTAVPNLLARLKKTPGKWFSWTVDKQHNLGWFTLDSMTLTGAYEQSVVAFFRAVEKAGVTRVAVDLRSDSGGSSLAEAPFMQYLGVAKVQDDSTTLYFDPTHLRQELAEMTQIGEKLAPKFMKQQYPAGFIPVPPAPAPDQIFHGYLYLVTGPGCFSSAMDFAADVKFNHVGTIVGLPCGDAVTGFGEVKSFSHPASGVPFQVPTETERWPGLPFDTLVEPDIKVPLTVNDVQKGVDPVRRWFDTSAHTHSTG